MSTLIKPDLSERNKYWIPKHRYYELKHYCLQYPEWIQKISEVSFTKGISNKSIPGSQIEFVDPTFDKAEELHYYFKNIEFVRSAADASDPLLSSYILEAVTSGVSFEYLKTMKGMPCSRGTFYNRYRKFFWYLDQITRT